MPHIVHKVILTHDTEGWEIGDFISSWPSQIIIVYDPGGRWR